MRIDFIKVSVKVSLEQQVECCHKLKTDKKNHCNKQFI
ncbi:unnamed protein product [Prunus brigantina]